MLKRFGPEAGKFRIRPGRVEGRMFFRFKDAGVFVGLLGPNGLEEYNFNVVGIRNVVRLTVRPANTNSMFKYNAMY